MTKVSRPGPMPDTTGWRLVAKFKLFRTSSNTGGKLSMCLGMQNITEGIGGFAVATNEVKINLLDFTAGTWTDVEVGLRPLTWASPSYGPVMGFVWVEYGDDLSGGDAWIAGWSVEEQQITPNVPQITASSGYTLKITDQGKHIYISTGGVTVPPNSVVQFPIETIVTVANNSGTAQTISQGSGVTLRLAGTTTTGNRSLAAYGIATLLKVETDTWLVSGAGVT